MQTALGRKLTQDDLLVLGRRLAQKAKDYEAAMNDGGWREKRRKYKLRAEGNYEDRITQREEDIFSKNNHPLEFITGIAEFMAARCCDDLFGSEPFFAAIPQGSKQDDPELADQIERHAGYKLSKAQYKERAKEAIKGGFNVGEGIQKVTWRADRDKYERLAQVMVQLQPETGKTEPVVDENGDYVYDDDQCCEVPGIGHVYGKAEIVLMPPDAQFKVVPETGDPLPILITAAGPLQNGAGEFWYEPDVRTFNQPPIRGGIEATPLSASVLSKAEVFVGEAFEEMLVEEENTLYEGLEITTVAHGDFIAPLNIPSLCHADFVGQRLSLKRSVLRDNYKMDKATEAKIGTQDERPKNEADKPIAHLHEGEIAPLDITQDDDPVYKCIECYVKLLIKGQMRRVFALFEEESQVIIAIDYWANVTPNGVLPFPTIVPCPVPGRWWGRGYHEIYESEGDFIDRTFNAIVFRNKMHANPVKLIRLRAFKNSSSVKNIIIEPDKVHEIDENYVDANGKPIELLEFPDLDERTVWIFEMVVQMAQVRSGVTGASQGAIANLPSNGTATGVQSIMMSGSTLHKLPIDSCKDGLQDGLELCVKTLYANQNQDETIAYLEGDAMQVVKLNAQSVKGLDINIQLLLTRLHEKETLESAKAAIEAVNSYLGTAEAEKDGVRPLYEQVLKSLRITNADAILRKALPPNTDSSITNESLRVQFNYKDAPDDVKRQIEVDAHYKPSADGIVTPPPKAPNPDKPPQANGQKPPVGPPVPENAR